MCRNGGVAVGVRLFNLGEDRILATKRRSKLPTFELSELLRHMAQFVSYNQIISNTYESPFVEN